MILLAFGLLIGLATALGVAGPIAAGEIRRGREVFVALATERAAEGSLASWFEERWVDSTLSRPPGTRIGFLGDTSGGILIERTVEGVAPGIWLLAVRATAPDRLGRPRAQARLGWVVRADSFPGDTLPTGRLVSRHRVTGFQ